MLLSPTLEAKAIPRATQIALAVVTLSFVIFLDYDVPVHNAVGR